MSNLKYWLAAAHADNITPMQVLTWLRHFADIKQLMTAPKELLRSCGMTAKQIQSMTNIDWQIVDGAIEWSQRTDCHLICLDDSDYPSLLKEIADPPLVLFVYGDSSLLHQHQLAVVGSRRVSAYGDRNARQFSAALSEAGFVVASGLALGVDGAAHQGALQGNGKTLAVIGSGLQHIYPAQHKGLARQIIDSGGALISEFPLYMRPRAYHFPRRNRIISGLSRGVLVVEAAIRSGSLITARHALEQGREVFAIPGSIHQPQAKGCHELIRNGAKLVEQVSDILEEFAGLIPPAMVDISNCPDMMPNSLTASEQKIYEQVGVNVTPVDEIILRSGLTVSEVSSILLSLELHGHIQAVSGGYVR